MTGNTVPVDGVCGQCHMTKPCLGPRTEWGRVPGLLCLADWKKFAQARKNNEFVDFRDAFNNATDKQMEEA